jgi:hypothetical protein
MPAIASVDALERAAASFEVTDLDVDAEPTALAAARRSLADSGLLLLGGRPTAPPPLGGSRDREVALMA